MILCIETATRICSVALGDGGRLISKRETGDDNSHSENLAVFIQEAVAEAGIGFDRLDAVAVSMGPGSFTGLRIGVSTAKGLCYALDKPLISVNTLQSMAAGMAEALGKKAGGSKSLFCPMIDARRMEVYTALYDQHNMEVMPPSAEIIIPGSFASYLKDHEVYFSGDGADKCREVFAACSNAIFMQAEIPSARHMIPLAEKAYNEKRFEDVAYFEPYYLKDFIAGKPRVKGLHI